MVCGAVCGIQILSISLPRLCLPATIRPSRARSRGTGKDESAPPVCRFSGKQERGFVAWFVAYPAPLFWGSLSSDLSLREGSEHHIPSGEGFYRPGPRRQGSSPPLRALDGCGPIQRRAYTRGCFFTLGFHSDNKLGSIAWQPQLTPPSTDVIAEMKAGFTEVNAKLAALGSRIDA